VLDVTLYEPARLMALDDLQHHPELVHDEEIWVRFTEDIVRGMGGEGDAVRACAVAIVKEWERHENFFLYDDALPTMATLRRHGVAIGLVSNGQRDLVEFVQHHGLDVDIAVGSKAHGRTKPHPSIFERALHGLGVRPDEGVMVGDSPADDIAGARALGMRAILLDRDGVHAPGRDRIASLDELPGVLGLEEH
jgi:HAD superfamily hydrolase (TIGR01549 family)